MITFTMERSQEDLLKELEYYTKIIDDFKKQQSSSSNSSAATKHVELASATSPSTSSHNLCTNILPLQKNNKYVRNTKYSLKKVPEGQNHSGFDQMTMNIRTNNTEIKVRPVSNCNELHFQKQPDPYKYVKPREILFSSNSETLSTSKKRQFSQPNITPIVLKPQDTIRKAKETKIDDVSVMLSKVDSIEKGLPSKTHLQWQSKDFNIKNSKINNLSDAESSVLNAHKSDKNLSNALKISPDKWEFKDPRGLHVSGDHGKKDFEEISSQVESNVKCQSSTPHSVSVLRRHSSEGMVTKSRFKLVKRNTIPVSQRSVKHYAPHKMVRKDFAPRQSGSASHASFHDIHTRPVQRRNIVTKHKLIKLAETSSFTSIPGHSPSVSRLKSWKQPMQTRMSPSEAVAHKLVKSYQKKSLVRSRYKLVRQAAHSGKNMSHSTLMKHLRSQNVPHFQKYKKMSNYSAHSAHVMRSPRKSKYAIVKSNTDGAEEDFNINSALGRTVENISRNKYKFIKPKKRLPLNRKIAGKSKLKIDRRSNVKSAGIHQRASYIILRGHVYKKAKQGLVKVGRSSSGLVTKRMPSKKIPDTSSKKISTLRTARHMVVRSIVTVVQHQYKRDHRPRDTPKKRHKYCLYYNRFGKCSRGENCPFAHDPEKVAVCTRFIRGTCQVENCPFSHKVTKEKMPVCRYFMKGSCATENCPYLHVNVGKGAEVCGDFLQGYCAAGEKCKKKHTLICPDYEKSGQCLRGTSCKMKHVKSKRTVRRRMDFTPGQVEQKEASVELTRPGVPVTMPVQEEYDDINLPMKDRHLPAFISILSPEEKQRDEMSRSTVGSVHAEGIVDSGSSGKKMDQYRKEAFRTTSGFQIKPNLAEDEQAT